MKKIKIRPFFFFSLILVFLCFWLIKETEAIKVSPGAFCIQKVDIGSQKDIGIDIIIENDTDQEKEYSLKCVQPRIPKDESLQGYNPMPDLGWFYFEKTSVIVPSEEQGKSRIYINIPDEEKFYNQAWALSCLVEYVGQKGLFQEAILTIYMVETKPKSDITERPHGTLGVSPSIVKIKENNGKKKQASFTVYNNTSEKRVIRIKSFVPDSEIQTLKINVSPGFEWAEKLSWIKPKVKKITVPPGETKEIGLKIKVPKKAHRGKKGVEELIFIESDKGDKKFVRICVEE